MRTITGPARTAGRATLRRRWSLLAGVTATVPLVVGLVAPVQAESTNVVLLTFDGPGLAEQTGTAAVEVRSVTSGPDVAVLPVTDPRGGTAARLPGFLPTGAPLAGFSVVDVDGVDDLNPGTQAFRFGADFNLDAVGLTSPEDNGNNLVQRGLADGKSQFKLQVDGAHASCRVKGAGGAAGVSNPAVIVPGTWYSAWCERNGNRLTLQVTRLADGYTWTKSVTHATGNVALPAGTPFTVGLKMTSPTTIAPPSSDQFNGVVDGVFLQIDG